MVSTRTPGSLADLSILHSKCGLLTTHLFAGTLAPTRAIPIIESMPTRGLGPQALGLAGLAH